MKITKFFLLSMVMGYNGISYAMQSGNTRDCVKRWELQDTNNQIFWMKQMLEAQQKEINTLKEQQNPSQHLYKNNKPAKQNRHKRLNSH